MASGYSVQVILDEKYKVRARTSSHVVIADEPLSLGGTNLGPNPYELLLASLGACTAMTIRMYAERKEWPLESLTVDLHHEKIYRKDCETCSSEGTTTEKIDRITRHIRFVGPLTDEQRARMLEIAQKCPVHRTLQSETTIVDTDVTAAP